VLTGSLEKLTLGIDEAATEARRADMRAGRPGRPKRPAPADLRRRMCEARLPSGMIGP
jgi:hypothetical protein